MSHIFQPLLRNLQLMHKTLWYPNTSLEYGLFHRSTWRQNPSQHAILIRAALLRLPVHGNMLVILKSSIILQDISGDNRPRQEKNGLKILTLQHQKKKLKEPKLMQEPLERRKPKKLPKRRKPSEGIDG